MIQRLSLMKFPFEKHTIDFSLNVNTRTESQMRLVHNSMYINKEIQESLTIKIGDNIQWKLDSYCSNPVQKQTLQQTGITVSCLDYQVTICRKGMSAINIMYFPALLVSTLALFSYFIPIQNVVRIQFTTTLLLTLIMLLLMVNRFLPITDENPYIEQIFLGLICMIFSVDFFVIMIQFYKIHYDKWQIAKKKQILNNS